MKRPDPILACIAREHLSIPTLVSRQSDSLDFHDVAVWQVEAALKAAFDAGKNAAQAPTLAAMRVMVAAPKLLEALDYLLAQTVDMDLKYGITLSEGEEDARAKALSAIAKANGRAA